MKKLSLTSPKTSFKEGTTTLYLDSEDNTQYLANKEILLSNPH